MSAHHAELSVPPVLPSEQQSNAFWPRYCTLAGEYTLDGMQAEDGVRRIPVSSLQALSSSHACAAWLRAA